MHNVICEAADETMLNKVQKKDRPSVIVENKTHLLTAMGLVHAGVGDLSGQGLSCQRPANQGFQSYYKGKFNMTFWICLSELKRKIAK